MSKIYTSYYAKVANIREPAILVRISQSQPAWFGKPMIQLPQVYPTWDMVTNYKQGNISWAEYTQKYNRLLEAVGISEIRDTLLCIVVKYKLPIVLVCWERSGTNCHRHLLAEKLQMGIVELTTELD